MRIVQTFWSAGRNPLEHSFGWLHPEYNLMSWALSCHSLREHYDEVVLYTDTFGKHVLIDTLHLPYTEVNTIFDDFKCLPQHWALAKIMTYSLQTTPFLHVDGDVYLPKPLTTNVIDAELVAQNREIGTSYYRSMMDRILSYPEIYLPEYIQKGLSEKSVASYNMGIFGGSNLQFINDYCNEVFSFININQMNNREVRYAHIDCNVFFEQVIFAVFADKNEKTVENVLGRAMIDEGYMARDFCALKDYDNKAFFHILGGHKRSDGVCNMLEKTLMSKYPDTYLRISRAFPQRHVRLGEESFQEIFNYEMYVAKAFLFIDASSDMQDKALIVLNPWLQLSEEDGSYYAAVPSIGKDRIKSILIKPLALNIITILKKNRGGIIFQFLKKELFNCFSSTILINAETFTNAEMTYLLFHGIIIAKNNN